MERMFPELSINPHFKMELLPPVNAEVTVAVRRQTALNPQGPMILIIMTFAIDCLELGLDIFLIGGHSPAGRRVLSMCPLPGGKLITTLSKSGKAGSLETEPGEIEAIRISGKKDDQPYYWEWVK